ncbi:MAG: DUF4157 domain-containing protein [Roseivirga sp.]|nr:DUF4157 domain-containing protein [Roseivirga sp.]
MLTYSRYKTSGRQHSSVASALQKKEYGSASTIQTKLTVGKPNDKYEQEADRVADQVVNSAPSQKPAIQKKCAGCEQEEKAQMKPALQKAEEEEIQTKPPPTIMKMEEEEVQPKIQRKTEEEDIQTKPEKSTDNTTASTYVESIIQTTQGHGSPMAKSTRAEMENGIGADFSSVRIHTDSSAIKMNQEMGARAFTTGRDVYFNTGEYRPETKSGKQLLAHELTHVVQQSPNLQMKRSATKITATGRPRISRWKKSGNTATVSSKGDTLAGLANSITGNWRDWGCIWIDKMKRADKSWNNDYYNWLEIGDTFDISNLQATTGKTVTIVMRGRRDLYLQAVQALYSGNIAGVGNLTTQLENISDGGANPIQNLTVAGHSAGGSMWGDNNVRFDPWAENPEKPVPNGIGSHSKKGPKRCWFTRNARVRFTGCSSEGVAQSTAQNFLRTGATATGTNHWLCGWARPFVGRWVTKDNSPCHEVTSTGTHHTTSAGLHGEPGLWVTHSGLN